jgi:hypothetical protein
MDRGVGNVRQVPQAGLDALPQQSSITSKHKKTLCGMLQTIFACRRCCQGRDDLKSPHLTSAVDVMGSAEDALLVVSGTGGREQGCTWDKCFDHTRAFLSSELDQPHHTDGVLRKFGQDGLGLGIDKEFSARRR